MLLTLPRALGMCLLLAGCPSSDPDLPECAVDSSAMLVAAMQSGDLFDVTDGTQVPLISAPQGGHILLVGVRLQTAGACQLDATGSLRDPTSNRVVGLEQRPLLLEQHADGWAWPRQGLNAMPNVAVCPSSAATTNVYDNPYRLEVSLTGADGSTLATLSAMVTPTCGTSQYCMSDCAPIPAH